MAPGTTAASQDRWAQAAAALAEASRVAGAPPPTLGNGASVPGASPAVAHGSSSVTRARSAAVGEAAGRGVADARPAGAQAPRGEANPEFVARAIALRSLSVAPRSRAQLERKLREKGCDDQVAARVLDRLTEVGLVDDEAYADLLVRSKQDQRGLAAPAIAQELREAGIERSIADAALEQVTAGTERVRAEELVAKRMRAMAGLSPEVQARRLAAMLARKGYPSDIAWPVVRDAIDAAREHRRD